MLKPVSFALAAVATATLSWNVAAQNKLSGDAIAKKVADRPNADPRKGRISFVIENKGRTRTRAAKMLRTETGATHRLLLAFDRPANIRGTSFLSYDHKAAARTDETWLHLPATGRTRRVPASDRADSFMGTELTFGDVKDSFKFGLADYDFSSGGSTKDGYYVLKGTAKSKQIAREIGYGGFSAKVDPKTWFPRTITFSDPGGRKLKTLEVTGMEKVGNSWTATNFSIINHRSGRSTKVSITNLSRASGASESFFDPARLDRSGDRMP